ncbi:MAG: hypothetical protein CMB80_02185 [Flammeovirgaceae bacterium]|nr:hypothetical protein [Flammeovirgaceae bacterium]|tara:strand:+ start:91 stop:687 length:597 start_codon:yes stop_codon:yes gene_type:complete
MRYFDVLTDICAQLNDPDMISLKDRAKDHFLRALAHLVNEGQFTESDISGYYKEGSIILITGQGLQLDSFKILKILSFYIHPTLIPDAGDEVWITPKSIEQMARINSTPALRPTKYDLFICRTGNSLRGYTSPGSNFTLGTDAITMSYVQDIDGSEWNDSDGPDATDFQASDDFLFSFSFTRRAIAQAVQTLMVEEKE